MVGSGRTFTETVLHGFTDTQTPLFYFTHAFQTDILIHKKEVYDGATPSGNAVMALATFFNCPYCWTARNGGSRPNRCCQLWVK